MAKAQPIMIGDGADSSGELNSGQESILQKNGNRTENLKLAFFGNVNVA
jgi:hypothetical protein